MSKKGRENYSLSKAVEELNCSRKLIYRLIYSKKVLADKINNLYCIPPAGIKRSKMNFNPDSELPDNKKHNDSINAILEFKRNLNTRFERADHNDVAVVFVNLENCTLQDASKFKDYLMAIIYSGVQKIIVDLTFAEVIDSPFIGAMISALKKLANQSGEIRLVFEESKMKSSTFYISGMDRVFNISSSLREALDCFLN